MIIGIIAFCVIGIRLLTRSDTLMDYANENPEIAYKTPEAIPTEDAISADETVASPTPSPLSDDKDMEYDRFTINELNDEIKDRITGISYPADDTDAEINYDDLRYLTVLYYDFNDEVKEGEIICNALIAEDLIDIFTELYDNKYQIEKIRLVDEYGGDDDASMEDNNSSCFNYRNIANSSVLSNHSYGMAIDINPFYNPYIVPGKGANGGDYIVPAGSESFADRTLDFDHKIDENDLCYKLFTEHGFSWGGSWSRTKDYQHFEKN